MPHSHLGARLPDTDKAGVLSTWENGGVREQVAPKGVGSDQKKLTGSEGRKGRKQKVPGVEYPEDSCLVGAFFS